MAYDEEITLRQASVKSGLLSEEEYDAIVNPEDMIHPKM
jgi:fumarate hydratase class II